MGISRVVDLRSESELDRAPGPLADHPGHVSAPLVDPRMEHLRDPAAERHLGDLYRGSVDRNGRTIAAAVRHLIEAPEGGVLVHCAAGKDRTGILVAILLDTLGTPADVITADYCASESNLVDYFAREMESTPDPRHRARLAELRGAPAKAMEDLLDHLQSRHGGGAGYLRTHGLSHEDLTSLSARLVA